MSGLSAKFQADFTSFYSAVDQANARLKDFQSDAAHVESSLNKMADSLSGRKLLQDATIAAQAVEQIGGASKLTDAELQKLAAQATAAVEKMRAIGVEVPPGIASLAAKLDGAGTSMGEVGDEALALGQRLLVAFGIGSIGQWVLSLGTAQRQLEDLSESTQIGTGDLQVLSAATQEYGVDSDQLGRALFQLSQRIAGGDASVVTGLHAIGLSIEDVRDKNPMDLFLTIEHALAGVSGAARDAAAADLFGGRLGASLTAFAPNVDEAIAHAKAFATVLSDDDVKALAENSRNIDLAKTNLSNFTAELAGPFAAAMNGAVHLTETAGGTWNTVKNVLASLFEGGISGAGSLVGALGAVSAATDKATASTHAQLAAEDQIPPAIDEETRVRQALAKVEEDANVDLAGYQKDALDRLKELGALNAKNAAEIAGVNAQAFDKYKQSVDAADAAAKKLAADQKKVTDELDAFKSKADEAAAAASGVDPAIAGIEKTVAKLKSDLTSVGKDSADNFGIISSAVDEMTAKMGGDMDSLKGKSQADLQQMAADAATTLDFMTSHSNDFTEGAMERQYDKWVDLETAAQAAGRAMADGEDKAAAKTDAENAKLDDQKKKAEAVTAVFSTQYDLSTSKGIQAFEAANPNAQVNAGVDYFKTHTLAQAISDGVVDLEGKLPGFAKGVDDFGGGPAIVGEDGPELVSLPRGASVLPLKGKRSGAGGETHVTVHQYISGVWDPQSRTAIGQVISGQLQEAVGLSKQL